MRPQPVPQDGVSRSLESWNEAAPGRLLSARANRVSVVVGLPGRSLSGECGVCWLDVRAVSL